MSYPSSIGLPPIVEFVSAWDTMAGKVRFVELVQERLNQCLVDEPPSPTVEFSDVRKMLSSATAMPDSCERGIDSPSNSIIDAVNFACVTICGSVRMKRKLEALRAAGPQNALDPRARLDGRSGEMDGATARLAHNTCYATFRQSQTRGRSNEKNRQ